MEGRSASGENQDNGMIQNDTRRSIQPFGCAGLLAGIDEYSSAGIHRALRMNCFSSRPFFLFLLAFALALGGHAADLEVRTDFEGGSARVESIDQTARVIRLMPGGDPQRGWPCWWYFRVDGAKKDERVTISLAGSDLPARNNGIDTKKPLSFTWAMPVKASVSTDGTTWRHTNAGRRDGARMIYEVTGDGGPLWVAWGPPFTPKDTDALIAKAIQKLPTASAFDLAQTREGRKVRALQIKPVEGKPPGIWIHARQHAWESGASWVARGFTEWVTSGDPAASALREQAEIVIVPIMDVDNAATGNGGKEAAPRDHNRDWDLNPVHPEVAAAQKILREWATAGRLGVFLDLHNPGASDLRPFFFAGPEDLLTDLGRKNRADFLALAFRHVSDPLPLEEKPRITGPGYHPLWRQISGQWVTANGNPQTLAVCLETSWNTPQSTTEGYLTVGRQLGRALAEYIRTRGPQ
jgi:hypothetical protein